MSKKTVRTYDKETKVQAVKLAKEIGIRKAAAQLKYETIKEYNAEQFRRITGVKRATFNKMIEILKKSYAEKHRRRGRKPKLSCWPLWNTGVNTGHMPILQRVMESQKAIFTACH